MAYEKLITELLENIGGKENVTSVTHCATRLRLVLEDETKVNKDKIEAINQVLGSVFSGGQYQVIIGTQVADVYKEFLEMTGSKAVEIVEESSTEQVDDGNLFNIFFKSLVGIMSPTFGVMGAVGILKGLLALATALHFLETTDGAYQIWYAVAQGFFYYLPIWVGFNASKVFGGNQYVGAAIAASLIFPDIMGLQSEGTAISFFSIPILLVNYSQSLFPAMISSYLAAKIEKMIKPRLHEALKIMFTPLLTMMITVPVVFLAVGPIMTWLSNGLANIIMSVYGLSPILFGIIAGATWQLIVIFGLHYAFIPVLINNVTTLGQDPINAVFHVTVFALAGVAIGYALKQKDVQKRSLAYSVGISGLLGITEPIIYSIALPVRRQFIYAMVSGGIAGLVQGLNSALVYGFSGGGLFAIPLFIAPNGDMSSMYSFVLAASIAFFGPIVLNFVFGTGEQQ
ncbi:PTS transporter subunit EIIC [Aerococcaceae bacterium zg-BR9]|uniref:PTS transporter subunit EIIC n=1 Tax=Aerococcaceae bacterium zg-1292 TaxID=2774330 RepID=UPI004064005A|nr:PTS transporter subunit EIIC [Aerococcaceae bacterium zg-BR9]